MRDIHSPIALREALQYVMSDDMPSEHRAVLIELLTAALRAQDAKRLEVVSAQPSHGPWQEEETLQLQSFLDGKTASSWQHADELLTHLSNRLGRDPHYVRRKATELGFGEGVDFRLAQIRSRERAKTAESNWRIRDSDVASEQRSGLLALALKLAEALVEALDHLAQLNVHFIERTTLGARNRVLGVRPLSDYVAIPHRVTARWVCNRRDRIQMKGRFQNARRNVVRGGHCSHQGSRANVASRRRACSSRTCSMASAVSPAITRTSLC